MSVIRRTVAGLTGSRSSPREFFLAMLVAATAVGAPAAARADVAAVVACRALPKGPAREDCFEKASADLEQQLSPSASGETGHTIPPVAGLPSLAHAAPTARPAVDDDQEDVNPHPAIRARVVRLTYDHGRPVFELTNGQVWASTDVRRLSSRPGGDHVVIQHTPVGMLLHFNGSFFGLQVVERN